MNKRVNYILLICNYRVSQNLILAAAASLWLTEFFVFAVPNEVFFSPGTTAPSGPMSPRYRSSTITLRFTTLGRNSLGELSVLHRDLYLTTHNTHKRQTSIPSAGFESAIPVI
jgi:hypothetical protein